MNSSKAALPVAASEPGRTFAIGQADGHRRLLGALAVSLALHALMFVLWAPLLIGATAAPTLGSRLAVRLISPARPAMPMPPSSAHFGEQSDRVRAEAFSPEPPPRLATALSSVASNVVQAPSQAGAPSFATRHEYAQHAVPQPKVSLTGTPSARGDDPSAQPEEAGFEANEGLRGYRLALAHEARRQRQALRQGVFSDEGEPVCPQSVCVVGLRLMLGEAAERQVILAQSSGLPALDEQALMIMRQAATITPVPDGLRGRRLAIELVIEIESRVP